MPFVQTNISKNTTPEDWRLREAATFAFGLVLEGPEPSALLDTVKQALVFLLQVFIMGSGHLLSIFTLLYPSR